MSCMFLFPSYFVKFSKKSLVLSMIGTLYFELYFHYIGPQGPCPGSGRVGFHSMTLDSRVQFPWGGARGQNLEHLENVV